MNCIYCNHSILYKTKNGYLKCARCKRKFSLTRIEKRYKIIECFCNNLSANQTKEILNINYITVKKEYDFLRKKIAIFLEERYNPQNVLSYDEYIYLEKSKKREKENIFDAKNFLTFEYEDKVYNILMPTLAKYKNQLLLDGVDKAYYKEFSNFLLFNKIAKLQKKQNKIKQFWIFFENEIVKYKGIKADNFFYYLKEIEFKFNFSKEQQIKILKELIFL